MILSRTSGLTGFLRHDFTPFVCKEFICSVVIADAVSTMIFCSLIFPFFSSSFMISYPLNSGIARSSMTASNFSFVMTFNAFCPLVLAVHSYPLIVRNFFSIFTMLSLSSTRSIFKIWFPWGL